jgi:heparin/heparan-sulfate lyase
LDPDPDFGRQIVAEALDTMQGSHFPERRDISRPIGRTMVAGAVVYDWCYKLLREDQKQAFIEQFIRLGKRLECHYPPTGQGAVTGHGSEWMMMRDLLAAGIAIYDEFPEMYRLTASRIFREHIPARNFWYKGHAFHQGSAYAETRCSSELYPLWIFDRLGAGNVYDPSQQFLPYLWIYMRRPDGRLLRAGDGHGYRSYLRSLLNASYYGDGYVLGDYLKRPGIHGMSKMYELLWRDPDLKPLPVTDLPLTRYFGSPYGWMVARTSWDDQAALCLMNVNIYNFTNHQHLDAGAFQLYFKGPLAMETGLYNGTHGAYSSPHNANYYKRTIAHNCMLIYDPDEEFVNTRFWGATRNDGGQRQPNGWREPKTLEELLAGGYRTGEVEGHWLGPDAHTPAFSYLKGDITQAYSDKVKEVRRAFTFLNFGEGNVPAALVVFDRVVSSNPSFKKYWLLHTQDKPAVSGNKTLVDLTSRPRWSGGLINTTLLPESANAEISIVGGTGKEFWVFGENFPNEPTRPLPDFGLGRWRIELSPRTQSATDLFLNVLQVKNSGQRRTLAVEKIENDQLVGVKLADRVVLFSKSGRRTNQKVGFFYAGDGKFQHLATDLAAGTWQVWRDGRIVVPAIEVSEEAGVICFEGTSGRYELRH